MISLTICSPLNILSGDFAAWASPHSSSAVLISLAKYRQNVGLRIITPNLALVSQVLDKRCQRPTQTAEKFHGNQKNYTIAEVTVC